MGLLDIKKLLRITDNSEDEILAILRDNAIGAVLLYLGEDTLPPPLEFVITEMTVIRYNAMMTEAIVTTANTGVAYTYGKEDLFPYMDMLDVYMRKGSKFRML
jgi:Phage gp6-like head-tail connector protein